MRQSVDAVHPVLRLYRDISSVVTFLLAFLR